VTTLYVHDPRTIAEAPHHRTHAEYAEAWLAAEDRELFVSLVENVAGLVETIHPRRPTKSYAVYDATIGYVSGGRFVPLREALEATLVDPGRKAVRPLVQVALSLLATAEAHLLRSRTVASLALATSDLAIEVNSAGYVTPGTTATNTYNLTNLSSSPGMITALSFAGSSGGTALAPLTFIYAGASYASLSALQQQANLSIDSGNTIAIGVRYAVPAGTNLQSVKTTLSASLTAGSLISSASATGISNISPKPSFTVSAAGGPVQPGTTATDTFAITNTSGQAATFSVPNDAGINGPGSPPAIPVAGYLVGANQVRHAAGNTPLQDLQAALLNQPVDDGATLKIGVQYAVPSGNAGQTITDTLTVAATAGGVQSSPQQAAVSDTIAPNPSFTIVGTNAAVNAGSTVTDLFTLTNTSGQAATFAVGNPPLIAAHTGALAPSGYTLNGASVVATGPNDPFAVLQIELNAVIVANDGTLMIGVQYTVPPEHAGHTIGDTLAATVTAGGVTSASQSATVTDTILPAPPPKSLPVIAKELYAKRSDWQVSAMTDPVAAFNDLNAIDQELVARGQAGFDEKDATEAGMAALVALSIMGSEATESILAAVRNANLDQGSAA